MPSQDQQSLRLQPGEWTEGISAKQFACQPVLWNPLDDPGGEKSARVAEDPVLFNELISTQRELAKKKAELQRRIKAQGAGMSPEEQVQLFRRPGPWGAKTIVKRVFEGHDGKPWFESGTGGGTTFLVSVPRQLPSLQGQPQEGHL